MITLIIVAAIFVIMGVVILIGKGDNLSQVIIPRPKKKELSIISSGSAA